MTMRMRSELHNLLVRVQRRLPSNQRLVQEAFTSNRHRKVMIRFNELQPDTFYLFGELAARAFHDAVVELAEARGRGVLTVTYPLLGEFRGQRHRIQRLAGKLETVRVLANSREQNISGLDSNFRFVSLTNNPLNKYRLAIHETAQPVMFVSRETTRYEASEGTFSLGFFTFGADLIEEMMDDIFEMERDLSSHLDTFDRLALLHQTTQRINRELENYARRLDQAIQQARRRPDLLTPARFEKIVNHVVVKMEQLKTIPLRALRRMEKKKNQT